MPSGILILNNQGLNASQVRALFSSASLVREDGVFMDPAGTPIPVPKRTPIIDAITKQAKADGLMNNVLPTAYTAFNTTYADFDYLQMYEKKYYLHGRAVHGWDAAIRDTEKKNGPAKEWDAMVLSFEDDTPQAEAEAVAEIVREVLREPVGIAATIQQNLKDGKTTGLTPAEHSGYKGKRAIYYTKTHENTGNAHHHFIVNRHAFDPKTNQVSAGSDMTKQGEIDLTKDIIKDRMAAAGLGHVGFTFLSSAANKQQTNPQVTAAIVQNVEQDLQEAAAAEGYTPSPEPVSGAAVSVTADTNIKALEQAVARNRAAMNVNEARRQAEKNAEMAEINAKNSAIAALLKQEALQTSTHQAEMKAKTLEEGLAAAGEFAETIVAKASVAVPDDLAIPENLKNVPVEIAQNLVAADAAVTQLNGIKQAIDDAMESMDLPAEIREALQDPVEVAIGNAIEAETARAGAAGGVEANYDAIEDMRNDPVFVTQSYWDAYNDAIVHVDVKLHQTEESLFQANAETEAKQAAMDLAAEKAAFELEGKQGELNAALEAEAEKRDAIIAAIAAVDPDMAARMKNDIVKMVQTHSTTLVTEKADLEKTLNETTGVLNQTSERLTAAEAKVAELNENIAAKTAIIVERESQIEVLMKRQVAIEERIKTMVGMYTGKGYESTTAETAVRELAAKIPELTGQIQRTEGEKSVLREEVSKLSTIVTDMQVANAAALQKLREDMESKQDNLQKAAASQIQGMQAQILALQKTSPGVADVAGLGFAATPEKPGPTATRDYQADFRSKKPSDPEDDPTNQR